MKKIALAASFALTLCGSAQASLVEIVTERAPLDAATVPVAHMAATGGIVVLQAGTSDLAEPDMFAMMLLGLVLIGYRATRDSSEKFK
ncbi:MAG: hypothetical protein V4693_09745 [Pseudomonadota bacterium]